MPLQPGKIAQENWALQSVVNGKRRGAITRTSGYRSLQKESGYPTFHVAACSTWFAEAAEEPERKADARSAAKGEQRLQAGEGTSPATL